MNLATLLRVLFFLEHEYDEDDTLSNRIQQARAYVDGKFVSMTVVASVNALPANATVREFFRVPGDPNIYVGNGQANPLTKIPTQPL